jgi:dUTPase
VQADFEIQLLAGWYGKIAPRMDLVLFHHIDIGPGLVDEDFRGQLEWGPVQSYRKTIHSFSRL